MGLTLTHEAATRLMELGDLNAAAQKFLLPSAERPVPSLHVR
jgi:hypothetical protein